jgi:glutathione synthase
VGIPATFSLSQAFAERPTTAAAPPDWAYLGEKSRSRCACDVIFMRKDPPFDMEYIYTTYLLSAENDGVLVVNPRPLSAGDCNEVFATAFPHAVHRW